MKPFLRVSILSPRCVHCRPVSILQVASTRSGSLPTPENESSHRSPPTTQSKRIRVAFISDNAIVAGFLSKNGSVFADKYHINMFKSLNGTKFASFDVIILDGGLYPFTVESFITRFQANTPIVNRFRQGPMKLRGRKRDHKKSATVQPDDCPPEARTFPEFAYCYDDLGFTEYADSVQTVLDEANVQYDRWKRHLFNDGGVSLIRLRDPKTQQFIVKRSVLLPSTAIRDWGYRLPSVMTGLLDLSFIQFPSEYIKKLEEDPVGISGLYYFKKRSILLPRRPDFENLDLWKLDIMLKKWRTDQVLTHWGAKYTNTNNYVD